VRTLRCGTLTLDLSQPLIMGVVNVTPDSFSDGGKFFDCMAAIDHARRLVDEGAAIVDVGGESTRPGAVTVSESEEIARVVPVIEALADVGAPISVDTRRPAVMRAALRAGISMINDVDALSSEGALDVVAPSTCAVCLMHKQGDPATMQSNPRYTDVVGEVVSYLRERIAAAERAGIGRDRIVVDPGFGFGKTVEHNLSLLRDLHCLVNLGYPVLVGLSRKSMLGAITGAPVGGRLAASVGAALIAAMNGASIVRVHDVAATRDVLAVWRAVRER